MVYHLTNDQLKSFLGHQQNSSKFVYESTIAHEHYEPLTFSNIQHFWQNNKNYNFPFSLDTLKMTKTQKNFCALQNMEANEIFNFNFEKDKSYFYLDNYESSFFSCSLDTFSMEQKLIILILRINSYFLFSMGLINILPQTKEKEYLDHIYKILQFLQARQITYFSMFDYYVMQKPLLFSAMRYLFLCFILAKTPPSVIDFVTKDSQTLIKFLFSDNNNDIPTSNKKELIFFAHVFCEKKKNSYFIRI
jgi:hypothetical protein